MFGADARRRKADGSQPVDLARRNKHADAIALLTAAMASSCRPPVEGMVVSLQVLCALRVRDDLRATQTPVDLLPLPDRLKLFVNFGLDFPRLPPPPEFDDSQGEDDDDDDDTARRKEADDKENAFGQTQERIAGSPTVSGRFNKQTNK